MVKEMRRRCGPNMSLHKCAGEALTRGNGYLDWGEDEVGWMLRQPEWVQEYIIVYSEEKAQAKEAAHEQTMKKYGDSLLKHFQEEVERQRRISWERYAKST